jgi:pimeloyl-ACP methyl ester carboxylesterase
MRSIYIFSGLGTDERVMRDIDLSGFQPIFVQWMPPFSGEGIEDYCKRLSQPIDPDRPVLIGLSFGGMIAVEVGKHIATEKIILIASAKTKHEIPFYYRLAGLFGLHRLLPTWLMMRSTPFSNWAFGVKSPKEKQLLADILTDMDPVFFKWAIREIVRWKNEVLHDNLLHIHGTADRILPYLFVKPDITVEKGGHFMTVNKAMEVTGIVRGLLDQ